MEAWWASAVACLDEALECTDSDAATDPLVWLDIERPVPDAVVSIILVSSLSSFSCKSEDLGVAKDTVDLRLALEAVERIERTIGMAGPLLAVASSTPSAFSSLFATDG